MNIKVISQNGCSPCEMVKNFLRNEGVSFTEENISENPEVGTKYGVLSVPVILLLDGDAEISRVVGFNVPEIKKLISKL